jgi:hypothetical protein
LAIDPLHHILWLATQEGILQTIWQRHVRFIVSLYVDDAGIFVGFDRHDMRVVRQILDTFGGASGLRTNLAKSEAFPNKVQRGADFRGVANFPAKRSVFPCTYLRLPVHHSWLKAIYFQPLIDKLGVRLAGWWAKHFTKAVRVLLCRSVLPTMVIYHLAVSELPAWIIRRIDKIKRNFP